MKKFLAILGIAVLVLAIGALVFLHQFKTRALPDYNQDIKLSGLNAEVTVLRDSFAVPHIYAENEHDLYVAVGFLMAQDRLWQMDLLRHVTQGRLAEMFGADLVEADVLFRSLRFTEKSRRILAGSDQDLQETIAAFADGVNQFINQAGKKLPPEFGLLGYTPEPWLPEHSLNLIGYMAWDLSTGWPCDLLLDKLTQALGPEMAAYMVPDMDSVHNTITFPGFKMDPVTAGALTKLSKAASIPDELGLEVFRGSNNWAVSGKKSATGMPLLANDMHLGLNVPGIWYQMHQVIPGKLNVTGVALPGQPMIITGHNDSIAWGFTNVMTDDADFYAETINPADSNQYLLNGAWKNLEVRQEKILVSGGEPVIRSLRFTHRGPIVTDFRQGHGKILSMRWLGNEDSNEVLAVYKLNRAGNWTEFRDALRNFVSVNQNAVYADVRGNIGLQSTIGIPVREGDRILVYPGDTDRYDWKGLVPFDQLPNTFNPESGFVASANCKTAPEDYPYYISDWYALPYRINRILEMLNEKDKLGTEDFIKMQGDAQSAMAAKFTRFFLSRLNVQGGLTPEEKRVYELMRNWDFRLLKEGSEALIFEKWYYNTGVNLVRDHVSSDLLDEFIGEKVFFQNFMENMLLSPSEVWSDDLSTPLVRESLGDIIGISFRQTIKELSDAYGPSAEKWNWGKVHTITLAHPMSSVKILNRIFGLNRGPFSVGGSFHTVGPYSGPLNEYSKLNNGASQRHIFDTSDWDRSLTIIPTGNSGIPASKHYCDQSERYMTNQYHTDVISESKVEVRTLYRMKFTR